MIKKVILLAVAVIALAVLHFRTDATSSGKSGQPGVLDDITAKMVLLLQKDGGGPAAVQGKADVKDSPYFKKIDVLPTPVSPTKTILFPAPCFPDILIDNLRSILIILF